MEQNLIISGESQDQHLRIGYSKDELQYVQAQSGQLLKNMSAQDMRMAFVKPMTMHGIKQFPSPEEMEMMRMMISKHYVHLTHGHFHLAFELNVLGTHWEKVSPYGIMSAEFIAAVLKAYNEHMRNIWKTLRHKVTDIMLEASPLNEQDAINILMDIIKKDKENMTSAADTISSHMITKLYMRQVINDEWWTDDEWNAFHAQAKAHANSLTIQLRASNPYAFKDAMRTTKMGELKRLMYRDLISNKYEKLIAKLEEL
jgi:hypothetical protein